MATSSLMCCRSSVAAEETSVPPDKMRRDYVFVVNPNGANGKTGREWKKFLPKLTARIGKHYNVQEALTSGPMHAVEIAREAIKNGASAVIAVGGDGTLNEVVNGFFEDGKLVESKDGAGLPRTALGLIPLGTGSDFARTFGWQNNAFDALNRISKGRRQQIDIGFVKTEQENAGRYFINVADLHLSAKAGYNAAKYKQFGNLCYVIGALQAFLGHKNQDMRIRIDENDWKKVPQVTSMAIGNAKYFGGGMKIAPNANPSGGEFDVVTLQDFKWFDFIFKLPKLYNGTHLSVRNVSCERTRRIEVQTDNKDSKSEIFVQADGENVGFLPATFVKIPGAIDLFV